jgi:hypothetical protein
MYYRTYLRKSLRGVDQPVERVPFREAQFKEAGLQFAPSRGMPMLEAFQLINKWNTNQLQQNFVYGLE